MGRITYISSKCKKMHISITDDLKKRFHASCVMRGKNMSQVVIELIEQWLESNEVHQAGEIKRL
ncbi:MULTISPECIES: plasmid partition protein ParG [Calothrix]|nr:MULTISPECIES: plasmid partition protein ParG [Calothrix]